MTTLPDFQQAQYAFAAHIRDPANNAAPKGIEDRRLNIYRELFFNNISGLLAQTFPVLQRILGEEKWRALIRDFYAHYCCQTPIFTELPKEFIDWLNNERQAADNDPAFMYELAHYEWVELALNLADEPTAQHEIHRYGDLLNSVPLLSPLAWSLCYQFPVHRIGPDNQPQTASDAVTHLVVYRDREDQVGFLEINAMTAALIALLANNEETKLSGLSLLNQLAEQFTEFSRQTIQQGGAQILEQLRQKDIVLGTLAA